MVDVDATASKTGSARDEVMQVKQSPIPSDDSAPRVEQSRPVDASGVEESLVVAAQMFFPDAGLVALALEAGRIGIWAWVI